MVVLVKEVAVVEEEVNYPFHKTLFPFKSRSLFRFKFHEFSPPLLLKCFIYSFKIDFYIFVKKVVVEAPTLSIHSNQLKKKAGAAAAEAVVVICQIK